MTRHLILSTLGLLLLPMVCLRAEEAPNLVPNPGMEETAAGEKPVPTGWSSIGNLLDVQSTDEAHEGSQALEIRTPRDRVNGWVRSQVFRVDPNTLYRVRVAILARGDDGRAVPFYGVRVYESEEGWNPPDGEPYLITWETGVDNGREWQIKEGTFRTRESVKWVYIGLLVDAATPGVVLLDDVSMSKAP